MGENELGWKRGWFVGLKCSFEILSEKYMANSCDRATRGDGVGRKRLAVLCRVLLIVFQREYRESMHMTQVEKINWAFHATFSRWRRVYKSD